jgi:hypothetical protein
MVDLTRQFFFEHFLIDGFYSFKHGERRADVLWSVVILGRRQPK